MQPCSASRRKGRKKKKQQGRCGGFKTARLKYVRPRTHVEYMHTHVHCSEKKKEAVFHLVCTAAWRNLLVMFTVFARLSCWVCLRSPAAVNHWHKRCTIKSHLLMQGHLLDEPRGPMLVQAGGVRQVCSRAGFHVFNAVGMCVTMILYFMLASL